MSLSSRLAQTENAKFETALNDAICKLQSALVRKHGDTAEVSNIIRMLTAQAKARKSIEPFIAYGMPR
jgi:hypothetical protein